MGHIIGPFFDLCLRFITTYTVHHDHHQHHEYSHTKQCCWEGYQHQWADKQFSHTLFRSGLRTIATWLAVRQQNKTEDWYQINISPFSGLNTHQQTVSVDWWPWLYWWRDLLVSRKWLGEAQVPILSALAKLYYKRGNCFCLRPLPSASHAHDCQNGNIS